ncbi:unnamed protein product [Plutella xylostella]|uniref:(diamondback moth) hypothetical protein n=1 Tax=Plutella xylostella TaxID=51655 RepID=A0A8S4GAA2_PLUXY|nr:unnamed protein product [Plutella xylostella]
MNCRSCNKAIIPDEKLNCLRCKRSYHYACLNITREDFNKNATKLAKSTQCYECTFVSDRSRGRRNDNTPVGKLTFDADMSQDEPAETTTTIRADDSITYDRFSSLLETKIDSIMGRIVEFKDEIKKEMLMLANRLSAVESENQQLRTELQQLKQQPPISPVVNELHSTINDLKTEQNERDQSSLLNDVEITGLPEFEKESTGHLVMAIGAKLGMVLEERDVVSAARVGARRPPPGEGAPASRPRPLVVRLARRALRDQLVENARVRRGLTTADMGLPSHTPKPFHVNERLTKVNRSLFGKARELGRTHRWRFIWTREGRIFARQNDTSPKHLIRSDADLESIFRTSTTRN